MYKKALVLLFIALTATLVACSSPKAQETALKNSETTDASPSADEKNTVSYDMDELAEDLLNTIQKATEAGYILKDTTGDVTADKLTLEEFNDAKTAYKEKILNDIKSNPDSYKVSEENGKTVCKYSIESVLNKLGIGTHMGVFGDDDDATIDQDGVKTYTFDK